MITDAQWLGLVARSESNYPHVWQPIMWVVRNRVEGIEYPASYGKVVTDDFQFSYFNKFRHIDDPCEVYYEATKGYAGDSKGWGGDDLGKAISCAWHVLGQPRYMCPFSHRTYWFWSRVSMNPPGTDPKWAVDMRKFSLSGIDPERFMFAER